MAASVVTVFIQTSRFSPEAQYANSVTLEMVYPSDNTQELLRHAVEALQRIYRKGYEYRKAGVMLSGMVPDEQMRILCVRVSTKKARPSLALISVLNETTAEQGPARERNAEAVDG